jgi:hypothetical protein
MVWDAEHTYVCADMTMCVVALVGRVGGGGSGPREDENVEHCRILHEPALTIMGRGESRGRTSTSIEGVIDKHMPLRCKANASSRMR